MRIHFEYALYVIPIKYLNLFPYILKVNISITKKYRDEESVDSPKCLRYEATVAILW
jgi:hypothetical protein